MTLAFLVTCILPKSHESSVAEYRAEQEALQAEKQKIEESKYNQPFDTLLEDIEESLHQDYLATIRQIARMHRSFYVATGISVNPKGLTRFGKQLGIGDTNRIEISLARIQTSSQILLDLDKENSDFFKNKYLDSITIVPNVCDNEVFVYKKHLYLCQPNYDDKDIDMGTKARKMLSQIPDIGSDARSLCQML